MILFKMYYKDVFKDGSACGFFEVSSIGNAEQYPAGAMELCDTIATSRDYLAKLRFLVYAAGPPLEKP